jgi:hypothetical protein
MLRLVFVQKDEAQQKERALASGPLGLLWRGVPSSAFIGVGTPTTDTLLSSALVLLRPVVDHHATRNKMSADDRVSVVGVLLSAYGVHWRWNADDRTPTTVTLSVVRAK